MPSKFFSSIIKPRLVDQTADVYCRTDGTDFFSGVYQLETGFARIKINNRNTELCHPRPRSEAHSNEYKNNLGKSSTLKARLQEEVRRVEIAQGTRVRYTEMGVFSAVAGNL